MTVAVQNPLINYIENGSSTAFPVPFRYDAPTDLRAIRRAVNGVDTELVYGSDFTASPGPTDAGGTVTVSVAAPAGTRLTILRETSRVQSADYIPAGAFTAESHESALDKAMLIAQEQDATIARAVKGPVGERGPTLPAAGSRAGRLFAFDGSGEALFDIDAQQVREMLAAVFVPIFTQLASLVMFLASGAGAVVRSVQERLSDTIDRRDYATLQQALNRAAATTRALYLGDEDFEWSDKLILPNADVTIYGPGSGALTVTFTGTGPMIEGTNLSDATNITISGFRAIAGAADCGEVVSIAYTDGEMPVPAVKLKDIVAEFNESGTNYWSGGFHLTNARNSTIDECYVHGPTADLSKTEFAYKIDGISTDVKITGCQAVSVGTAVNIIGTAEGTLIGDFVAVDVNVGVSKVHIGGSEPWIAMSNWHINARQTGIYIKNALQTTITNGLLYAQNATGNWIGIHIDDASAINQDLMIDALIDGQLAGGGATSTTGMKIVDGNGIHARLKMRSLDIGVEMATGVTNTLVEIDANNVDDILAGAGVYEATNRVTMNLPGVGYALPKTSGPLNPNDSNTATKSVESYGFGRDTAGTVKPGGGFRAVSQDSNWVSAQLELMVRRGDALVQGAVLLGNGSPEGVVTAPRGAFYTRADGGAGSTLYVKESGTGNTGWVAK